MDVADRDRLLKLIGMLGSSFEGERSNALTLISNIATKYKMPVHEAIAAAHGAKSQPEPRRKFYRDPPPQPPPQKQERRARSSFFGGDDEGLLASLRSIINSAVFLSSWEANFAGDVAERYAHDYELSEKQVECINKIIAKAERQGWTGA